MAFCVYLLRPNDGLASTWLVMPETTSTHNEASRFRRRILAGILVSAIAIVVLVSVTYRNAPKNGFHFDDLHNVRENRAVHAENIDLESLRRAAMESPLEWRKLAYVSFAIDWWRGAGQPSAFQHTNVALHTANALLVLALFLIALAGTRERIDGSVVFAATAGAGIWAVHPIQVQSVTYIVQRMTELATFFTLLTVVLYVSGRLARRRSTKVGLLSLSALAMVCGAFSKENAWVAPVLLLLTEYGLVRRESRIFRRRIEAASVYIGLSAAVVAFLVTLAGVGQIAQFASPGYSIRAFTMIERVLTQPRVIFFHLSQILVPLPSRFSLEHDFSTSTSLVSPFWTLPALLAVLAWGGLGVWLLLRAKRRVAGYFVLWVPLTLLIESSILPLEMVYEHRMYLPSVGLFGLLAFLAARIWDWTHRPALLIGGPLLVIVGALAASTMARVEVWRSDVSLSENSVRNAPRSSRAWSSLGLAYLREESVEEAQSALRRSLELNPDNRWALEFMGVILMDQGRLEKAGTNLERVHRAHPRNTSTLNHLGELYLKQDKFAEAEEMFRRAVAHKPWVPTYYWNRAFALEQLSRCDEAHEEWNRYLTLDITPDNKATVLDHLRENYGTLGGSCYSQD